MEEAKPSTQTHDYPNYSAMSNEGQLRADTYIILASLLSNIPSEDLLDYLKHINPSPDFEIGGVGQAWQRLRVAASETDIPALDDEYHALFIGLGRGAVVPFGSWHITGFLMDKPLSELRDDLRTLGIESDDDQKDPEDHISALCETMALIITADDIDESRQRQFYSRHLHPWAEKFFRELQAAESAVFYKSVGFLGQQFMQLENQYLNILAH